MTEIKVGINDKISKILEILEADEGGGPLLYQGKLVQKPDDTTFAKMFVKDNSQFVCISSSVGAKITGLKWIRFPKRCDYTDYIYMERNHWDATCF